MNTIQKRFQPFKAVANGLVKVALFGTLVSGAILLTHTSFTNTAYASGHSHSGSGSTAQADISVTKTVDNDTVNEGDTVHFTITVTDNGPATSTDVVAQDPAEWGLTFVSATASQGNYSTSTGTWTIGTLASGQSATLVVTATINSGIAGTTGVDVHNTVTVSESSSETDPDTSNNTASVTICVNPCPPTTNDADIAVTKTADVTSTVEGGTVHFTIAVTDNGPATSTDVVVSDPVPSGLTFQNATATTGTYDSSTGTWTVGAVAPGATETLVVTETANTGIAGTSGVGVTNTATVSESSNETDTDLSNNTSSVTICVEPCPPCPTSTIADVSVAKIVDNSTPSEGDTVNYTITATDIGTATSTGVVATDTLPSGLTFENATASTGSYSTSTGTWTVGDLAPNATATLEIAALVNTGTAGTSITNTATIGETATDTDTSDKTATATINVQSNGGGGCGTSCPVYADISIVKVADVSSTNEGDTVNYTLTATDLGPATSTGVVATDTLPSGLTFENATASVGSYSTSTGAWNIGTLGNGQSATLQIAALVNTGTAGTTITNTATIGESTSTIDNNLSNNSSSVSVSVNSNGGGCPNCADIGIVKTVDNANPNPGDTVNYTLTVTDHGPATSTFVLAYDQLPPTTALSFLTATTSQGTYDLSTGDWTIGTLGPNATATLQLAAVVGSNQAGQSITNTASVSELSSLIDNNPANNTSTVTINVQNPGGNGCASNCGGGGGGGSTPTAEIGIVKTVDNANPYPGTTIHYTLTVTASGPNPSIGVLASDTLPADITFVSASSSMGSYNNTTGQWTIGNMANGTSATLVITATVNSTDPAGEQITNTGTVSESPTVVDQNSTNNTSSVTVTVAGGGGGGGGGNGGGSVLGTSTSTGQVLGASTCGLYLDEYIHPIRTSLNDPAEVEKLQTFLNQNLGINLPITGTYGPQTIAAVDQFQVKYHTEILLPWTALGLQTQFTPTDYVYQSTWRWINLIMCPSLNLPMPTLQTDDFHTSYTYAY